MKIAIAGPFPPYRGGIAHFNERLGIYLTKAGHEVTAYNFSFQYPDFMFPGTSQTEEGGRAMPFSGHRTIHSLNPISWFRTAKLINQEQPDVVLFRYWLPLMAPALGSIARRIRPGIKKAGIMDNVIPHEKRPGDHMLTRWMTRGLDGFVTLSDAVMKDLDKFNSTKPRINLFHPIYDQFGEPIDKASARKATGVEQSERIILFFGFIRAYKGLDILLKALGSDELRDMNVKLMVAGEYYEDKKPYNDLIASHGLEDRVYSFDHFIPAEEVRNYFCAADCVVQPYKSATQSGVTQIAYHFGRPMIVTNVSGLPEIVPDNECGYVVSPEPAEISGAIRRFYEGEKEEVFSKKVLERKELYSWEHFVKQLTDWLYSLDA